MNGDSHSKGRLSSSPKGSDNKVISVSEQDVSASSHKQVKSNETLESQSIIISDINASKKSSFQITGFVDNSSSESELQPSSIKQQSLDTVRKKNSAILSKNLESELATAKSFSPIVTPMSTNPLNLNDIQTSRFKVVRIASTKKPIVRGRWMCQDFNFDRPVQYLVGEPTNEEDVYYIEQNDDLMYKHFGMVYTDGHLTLDDNFIDNNKAPPDSSFEFRNGVCILPSPSSSDPPIQHRSSLIVTEPQEITDPEVCTSASMCAIDNKIEQAMDLVKSHLMFAVHEEVEQLKEQIKDLLIARNLLVKENNLLREHALPETLAKLKLLHLTGDGDDEGPQEAAEATNDADIDATYPENQFFSNDSGIVKNTNAEMAGNENGEDENVLYEDAADGYKSEKVVKAEDSNNNNLRADDDDDDDSTDEEDNKEKDPNHNQNNMNDDTEENGRSRKKTEESNSSEEDKDHNHHHQTVNNENPLNNSDSNFYDNNNSHNDDNVSITATTSLQNDNNENVNNNTNSTTPSS